MARPNKFAYKKESDLTNLIRLKTFFKENNNYWFSHHDVENRCMVGNLTCKKLFPILIDFGVIETTTMYTPHNRPYLVYSFKDDIEKSYVDNTMSNKPIENKPVGSNPNSNKLPEDSVETDLWKD